MYHQVLNHGHVNIFTEQTSKGTFIRKNGELIKVLRKTGINNKDTWDKIMEDGGSIQGIKELDKWCYLDGKMVLCSEIKNGDRDKIYPVKDVFRTFKEINQMDLVKQVGVGQQYIDQSVSLNLVFPSIINLPKWINQVTMEVGNKVLKHYTI